MKLHFPIIIVKSFVQPLRLSSPSASQKQKLARNACSKNGKSYFHLVMQLANDNLTMIIKSVLNLHIMDMVLRMANCECFNERDLHFYESILDVRPQILST